MNKTLEANRCPECGGHDLEWGDYKDHGEWREHNPQCLTCKAEFTQIEAVVPVEIEYKGKRYDIEK